MPPPNANERPALPTPGTPPTDRSPNATTEWLQALHAIDRLTDDERAARDRQRRRVRYSLDHPAELIVDRRLARDRAYLDAHDVTIIDWNTIQHARAGDPRWDEPTRTPVPVMSSIRRTRQYSGPTNRTIGVRYLARLVEGEYDAVANANTGERNNVLARAAFRYGQCLGAGLIDEPRATAALEEAAARCGLPHREAVTTIRVGIRAGARHPLETR
jgi:hypothetical protein